MFITNMIAGIPNINSKEISGYSRLRSCTSLTYDEFISCVTVNTGKELLFIESNTGVELYVSRGVDSNDLKYFGNDILKHAETILHTFYIYYFINNQTHKTYNIITDVYPEHNTRVSKFLDKVANYKDIEVYIINSVASKLLSKYSRRLAFY